MIYLSGALKMLSAAGLLTKLLMALGLAASLWAAVAVWHHKIYKEGFQTGYHKAISDIAEENADAIGMAVEKRGAWQACKEQGGHWIQRSGSCT